MPRRGPRDIGGTLVRFRIRPVVSRHERCWVVEERGLLFWRNAAWTPSGWDSQDPQYFPNETLAALWVHEEMQARIGDRAHREQGNRYITEVY